MGLKFTELTALIGAITGTLALIINWRNWRQNRSRLVIEADLKVVVHPPFDEASYELNVSIAKEGPRVSRIRKIGLLIPPTEKWIPGCPPPQPEQLLLIHEDFVLNEHDRKDFVFQFQDEKIAALLAGKGTLFVEDSLGKRTLRTFWAAPPGTLDDSRERLPRLKPIYQALASAGNNKLPTPKLVSKPPAKAP